MDWVAIADSFDPAYDRGFRRCWSASRALRAATPLPQPFDPAGLAVAVIETMRGWGSGRRRAPAMRTVAEVERALATPELSELTREVATWFCDDLPDPGRFPVVAHFELMRYASERLLSGNTGVNYPSKLCMLLAGCGPAFDGRVRRGLTELGVRGWTATQQEMPGSFDDTIARRMRKTYIWAAKLLREERAALEVAAAENDAIRWHVGEGALFRLADMALYVLGKQAANDSASKTERNGGRRAASEEDNMIERATWAGRSTFQYQRDGDGGVLLAFGSGRTRRHLTGATLQLLLKEFEGRTVEAGTSRTAPPEGSLGEWLLGNFTPTATASYVAPVLIDLGHARKTGKLLQFGQNGPHARE